METMTIKEVANLMSVSDDTIRNWIKRGNKFPKPFRVIDGGKLLWLKSNIEQFLNENN